MKLTVILIASIMLLSICAESKPDQFSTNTPGGSPTPPAPTSPNAIGLQTPPATSGQQAPIPQEASQGLMKTDQQSAYSGSPGLKGTSSTYTQVIVPPSRSAPNSLFVSYAPQTAVGCNIYANLPLWMQTSSSGDI